ncbi:MAG: IS30 family transposase [Patescibacteria group bacterium]
MSDEIKLNSVNGKYDPLKANHKAYVRRKYSKYQGMKIVNDKKLKEFVDKKLFDDQSPRVISGRIKKKEKNIQNISKDSIHRYIKSVYGRRIEYYRKTKKARRRGRRAKSKKLSNRTFIDKRPKIINLRKRIGDTESDFIVSGKSGKGILLVVVDRKSRNVFIEKITKVTINNVNKAFLKIKKRFPEMRTITTDNDILLQKHKELEELLDVKIYFCDPYSSWQKGTVENANKYIRRYIPKGSNISKYSKYIVKKIEVKMNNRFMECLDHSTPYELLEKHRKKKKKR